MGKRLLTGIKPTGQVHLGNYIGSIRPSLELAEQGYKSYFLVADYHSLTSVPKAQDVQEMRQDVAACWLACGLDPNKHRIFFQSDIPELLELSWILACMTSKGLMNRAHSYKSKQEINRKAGNKDLDDGINMGLYSYPILMSADILLFSPDIVPVGKDQVQHLEMVRDICKKFNHVYKTELFSFPKAFNSDKLLLGLDGQKMSKSYNNYVPLFCDSKTLRKTIMKIKTDSLPPKAPKSTSESIIFQIYSQLASKQEISDLDKKYQEGISWGEAKEILYEKIESLVKDKRQEYARLTRHPNELRGILKNHGREVREEIQPFMQKIRKTIGLF